MQEAVSGGYLTSLYVPWDVFHDEAMETQEQMLDPIAFAASSNPDIMYYHEAITI